MITDRAILLACNEGQVPATLRLYGWKRPTLSIGYSQDISKYIDLESCKKNNIPVVRRFTGGRALLHQYELTYSVIAPIPHPAFPGSLRGAFERISRAILESLEMGGIEAAQVAARKDRTRNTESGRSPACFSVANHCEITVQGKKLVGSAQRRLRSAFLQHGSVLLDTDPHLTHGLLKYSS
ncbi:MAG: lipoate--protein ligase family protein, partial [Nitrospinae bacterium]|nr:lipoate--protein ligase family protein [Nitrospinota bacterium]